MDAHELTVMIGTDQPAALAAFYGETLGLPRVAKYEDPVFRAGEANIRILNHSQISGSTRDPARIQLNLFIEDVRGEAARLQKLGVRFVREPELESWGGIVATMQDPDGNYVQILQEPG